MDVSLSNITSRISYSIEKNIPIHTLNLNEVSPENLVIRRNRNRISYSNKVFTIDLSDITEENVKTGEILKAKEVEIELHKIPRNEVELTNPLLYVLDKMYDNNYMFSYYFYPFSDLCCYYCLVFF